MIYLIFLTLKSNVNEIIVIAKHKGIGVGFISGMVLSSFCYSKPVGIIFEVYVDEKFRKKGIATKMMDAIIKELKMYNVSSITLETSSKNTIAQQFYKKYGFSKNSHMNYIINF